MAKGECNLNRKLIALAFVGVLPWLMGATIFLDTATPNPGGLIMLELEGTWTIGATENFKYINGRARLVALPNPVYTNTAIVDQTLFTWDSDYVGNPPPGTYDCTGRLYYTTQADPTTYVSADSNVKTVTVQ